MSNGSEKFWQQHQKRLAGTPEEQNRLLKQTKKDAGEIATRKNPKWFYVECLKNAGEWRTYSASETFSIDDMAMYACKNVGCAINYCSAVKIGSPQEWEGSSDC